MFPGLSVWYCITTVCSSLGTTTSPAQHPWIALVPCVGLRPLWISLFMLTRLLLLFLLSSGHTILSEDPDLVSSTHAAWLTTFCFSSSVRSGVFFLALWVPALACAHPRPHTDTNTRSYPELKVMKPLKYESRDHVLYILESFANHSAAAVFSAHCVLKQDEGKQMAVSHALKAPVKLQVNQIVEVHTWAVVTTYWMDPWTHVINCIHKNNLWAELVCIDLIQTRVAWK